MRRTDANFFDLILILDDIEYIYWQLMFFGFIHLYYLCNINNIIRYFCQRADFCMRLNSIKSDMSDKQDFGDEMQVISNKFNSFTTIEPAVNPVEQIKTMKVNTAGTSCSVAEHSTSYSGEDNASVRNLPQLNLPEKILFVIDTAREENFTPYKLNSGAKYLPLFMIKRVVENFVCAKSLIQRSHEYALMTLDAQGCQLVCDFTNNNKTIVNHLHTISENALEDDQKIYDLGQLFEKIETNIPLPEQNLDNPIPNFVARVILIYARSNCIPKFDTNHKSFMNLMQNPYFFLDALYVHEPPSSENSCQEIYIEIAGLDAMGFSYIFEAGRNAAKLHNCMAKLLAHPLQRPPQEDVSCNVYTSPDLQKIHTNV